MSKSRDTFNKRNRQLQKLKQRQDKQLKMEERRENTPKGKKLEDMLAYVDENGNISSTPPDPRKKIVVRSEDISISTPKGNERDSSHTGTVQFFNEEKGFGFITENKFQERIFFHSSQLAVPVKLNDKVAFDTEPGERGPVAVAIRKIELP
ncbi:cold-shock protein [Flavihumibacter petaseus]|uniref:Putative DNA-binding protein n=1 Tax=Flavihumibacter petaseus NBRC 106054 TaxID=1220578 RepID=A0A0E9MZK6_9BACT|nr:cold shock domain-containing protein [Flavihumibacter petaseus]GAO43182.1 putative DNA-binding protein [Flavihumibacter petaseus NBRC 106054]